MHQLVGPSPTDHSVALCLGPDRVWVVVSDAVHQGVTTTLTATQLYI
jgi:hypothetical protein